MLEIQIDVPPLELGLNTERALRAGARAGRTIVRRRVRAGGGLDPPKDGGRPLRRSGEFSRSIDVKRYVGVDRQGRGITARLAAKFRSPPGDRVVFLVVPRGRRKTDRSKRVQSNYAVARVLSTLTGARGRDSVLTAFRSDVEVRSAVRRAFAAALEAELVRRSQRAR